MSPPEHSWPQRSSLHLCHQREYHRCTCATSANTIVHIKHIGFDAEGRATGERELHDVGAARRRR
jgi:hypothetical protein